MFKRHLSIAVMAACCLAAASAAVEVYRSARAAVVDALLWLVRVMPRRHNPDLAAWRRALAVPQVMPRTQLSAVRRPMIMPRWRMCPST